MRRPLCTLTMTALLLLVPAIAAAKTNDTKVPGTTPTKQRGTPDVSEMHVDFANATAATLTMSQTWEASRADAFRQSLDAYFGNGDDMLTQEEVQRVIAASEKDLLNKPFSTVSIDGIVATVVKAQVTLDGAVAAANGTTITIQHTASLTLRPTSGDSHNVTVTPIWDTTVTLTAPAGFVLVASTDTRGLGTQSFKAAAKTTSAFTLRPESAADKAPLTPPPASSTPRTNTTNNATQEVTISTPKGVPFAGLTLLLVATSGLALLLRTMRRR